MNQSEKIMAAVGTGAVTITELSRDSNKPIPALLLLIAAEDEIVNNGHPDQAVIYHQAQSVRLCGKSVFELYEVLKKYCEQVDLERAKTLV